VQQTARFSGRRPRHADRSEIGVTGTAVPA
jgi:hypothetical protein